jgi:tRNA threonylcarbamoyladenosine biosynthesis protein TsaB
MTDGLTLSLDGSVYAGSVAVIRGTEVLAERQLEDSPKPGRSGREENFMPMVVQCLRDAEVAPRDLARVVCGAGPGSFTSLRVAASIAKGIAAGTQLPLFAVSSLALIVTARMIKEGRWLAALPAMRGELFVALFEVGANESVEQTQAPRVIEASELMNHASALGAKPIGPAVSADQNPHARGVARILSSVIARGQRDIASWEPTYGRLAEAQVKWEAAHGRPLTAAG